MFAQTLNLWEAAEPPIIFFSHLTAANGLFAIFVTSSNGEEAMYYTLKDHQGSLAAVIHPDGDVERLSYDAWGRRRNPVGFGYDNLSTATCLALKKVESKREEVART